MKKYILLLALGTGIIYSCNKEKAPSSSGTAYLDLPASPYQYTGDVTTDNKATLGRVLFYEPRLSINNSVACASCHHQEFAFADNVSLSRGFENRLTKRNSMPIQNLSSPFVPLGGQQAGTFFWDGRESSLQNLIARPITNHVEMGIDDLATLPSKLSSLPYYQDLFVKAYGSSDITMDKISEAMSTFLMSINANNTKLDKVGMTVNSQLSPLEMEGFELFNTKYECSGCHRVFNGSYSSSDFMNIGLDFPNVDKGQGELIPGNEGKFKIPNLRNVALTAPYMHDGRFATLDQVLDHYSHNIKDDPNLDSRLRAINGQPLRMNIPTGERQAIIAFLNTLTDYDMITDKKFSNPFKVK